MTKLLTWKETEIFHNKHPFPSQLRCCILGSSGSGKTKLLFRLLLDGTLDYDKLVFCSPSLQQKEYQIIIYGLKSGLHPSQVLKFFEIQEDVDEYKKALDTIVEKLEKKFKVEVLSYNNPELLPSPEELNQNLKYKVLVICDDSTLLNQINPTQIFVYGRPLQVNIIYISQRYTRINATIRENTNMFIFFKQNARTIKEVLFQEIGDGFNQEEFHSFFKENLKTKHDYIYYNKDLAKWYNSDVTFDVLNMINQEDYYKKKAEAYRLEKLNLKQLKEKEDFSTKLFEKTSELFKPITDSEKETTKEIKKLEGKLPAIEKKETVSRGDLTIIDDDSISKE